MPRPYFPTPPHKKMAVWSCETILMCTVASYRESHATKAVVSMATQDCVARNLIRFLNQIQIYSLIEIIASVQKNSDDLLYNMSPPTGMRHGDWSTINHCIKLLI